MNIKKCLISLLLTTQLIGCAHHNAPSPMGYAKYNDMTTKAAVGAAAATGTVLLGALGAYSLLYFVGQGIAKGVAKQASGR